MRKRHIRTRRDTTTVAFGVLLFGCAGAESVGPARTEDPAVDPAVETPPLRVLVTGFNDWKELGVPPALWRCRDNPSCRLLLGDPTTARPTAFAGPLASRLVAITTAGDRPIQWSFSTLPVTWEVASTEPDYAANDIVVHLGLGVYDRTDVIYVEDGAYNERRGADAAGRTVQESIDGEAEGAVLHAPAQSGVAAKVRSLAGQSFGGITVEVMAARSSNSYLCNETHYYALQKVHASHAADGEPTGVQQAFFVHIPYAVDDDFDALADSVAGVITALVR